MRGILNMIPIHNLWQVKKPKLCAHYQGYLFDDMQYIHSTKISVLRRTLYFDSEGTGNAECPSYIQYSTNMRTSTTLNLIN